MTGEVNTWVAGSAGNWDVAENWSLGHVPTATEVATFDNTSDNNCAVNAAPDVYGMNLATGYDGTVTQGAVDIGVGAGGFTQAAGTFNGDSGRWVICSGSWYNKAINYNSVNVKLTGSGTIADSGSYLIRTIWITGAYSVTGVTFDTSHLKNEGTLTLYNAVSVSIYDATGSFINTGAINGSSNLNLIRISASPTLSFGVINCPLVLKLEGSSASGIITMGANTILGSSLTISSNHASNTITLDLAGFNLNAKGITVRTRGVLLGGEGVIRNYGNLDTSAGATNFETSQIIFTKSSTLKTGADQPLYDMLIAPDVVVTLGSNVTVSHTYGNGGTLIPGAFALTASGSSYDKVLLPTVLSANIGPAAYPIGRRFMRRLERVQ